MGLNHMNGRVEDAVTGRFLSADPFIPDPTNPQSYNRYSYVNNNPLTFSDPSGFSSCDLACRDARHDGRIQTMDLNEGRMYLNAWLDSVANEYSQWSLAGPDQSPLLAPGSSTR
jgi:hypothetical protein